MGVERRAIVFAPSAIFSDVLHEALEGLGLTVWIVRPATDGTDSPSALVDVEGLLHPILESGPPYVLINGDGLWRMDLTPSTALHALLRTSFVAIRVALRGMMRQRAGRIINLAPPLGAVPDQMYALRLGMAGLTKSVAREVGSRNITANMIEPGYVEVDGRQTSPYVALSRQASAAEVARVAAFVCTDDASYVTGQILRVDGGLDTT